MSLQKTIQEILTPSKGVKDVLAGREVIRPDKEDFFRTVDTMTDEAAIAAYNIMPTHNDKDIPYDSWLRFLKRGPTVRVNTPRSIQQAARERKNLRQRISNAYSKMDRSELFAGYDFWDTGRTRHMTVHLTQCVDGIELYLGADASDVEKEQIHARHYDQSIDRATRGGMYLLQVPSTSEDRRNEPYMVGLLSVPVIGSAEKHAVGLNFRSDHACEIKQVLNLTRKNKNREHNGCKHDIAAYWKIAEELYLQKGDKTPIFNSPFIIPTQELLDFNYKLKNQALIEERILNEETGKISTRRRRLNMAEREIGLNEYVKMHGTDKSFLTRGKVADLELYYAA